MTHDDDRLLGLESDLRAFRPAPPSAIAVERLAWTLTRPKASLSDRILAATLFAASLAACLILGLLVTGTPPVPVSVPAQAAVPRDTPTLARHEPLFARAEPSTND